MIVTKKNANPHMDPEMKEYVMQLWFDGVSEHVIERMVQRRIAERYKKFGKKSYKSA